MPDLDQISFVLKPYRYRPHRRLISILINGWNLADLLEYEVRAGSELEDDPVTPKLYAGLLVEEDLIPPSPHFLGNPPCSIYRFGERTQVLTCECGEPGCRPVICRIEVGDDRIVWSDFGQPHRFNAKRFWSYEGLGPFVFDRAQYEAALEALSAQIGSGGSVPSSI